MLQCERVGITRQGFANCSISILLVFLGQILAGSESSAARYRLEAYATLPDGCSSGFGESEPVKRGALARSLTSSSIHYTFTQTALISV
jgi:hypothetical protein